MTLPLHERIRSDFETRILSGDLAPGDRLPIEEELLAEYACSRMTVNKALSALAAAGLVERRRKAGTFVARPRVHSMVLEIADLATTIRARGQQYRFELIRRELLPPDGRSSGDAHLGAGGPLLEIDGVHLANDTPFAVERRLIALRAVPQAADVDFDRISPGSWLLQEVPWTEAETRISAQAAGGRDGRLLQIPPETACLAVERWTWRGTDRITRVTQVFPGDGFDLVARFGPADARTSARTGAAAGAGAVRQM